jgi:LacI family transcriptional regulator
MDVYTGKDSISENLNWIGADGGVQAVERRRVQVMRHPDPRAWAMSISSTIRPAGELDQLEVSSSAVKGRPGAGYGGIFWRFPRDARAELIMAEAGTGTDVAHGSLSPWLSIAAVVAGRRASVVLAQDPGSPLPWFLRTEGYLGAGPAVAWDGIRTLSHHNPLTLNLHAVVKDGTVDSPAQARRLLALHPTLRQHAAKPDLTHR